MRVGLFVTCLVDLMCPSIGFAALELLEAAGCEVVVPAEQTCCGQPAFNSGDSAKARALALKLAREFADCDYVVVPSGSCGAMLRHDYPGLAEGEEGRLLAELARRSYELTDFLVTVLKLDKLGRVLEPFAGGITYHDSCAGLRRLGVKRQPRFLLETLAGLKITEMPGAEECCGFGGAFSVKFGDVAAAIAARKCQGVAASGAETLVLGDLGCMLNIEGRLRREGDEKTRVLHVAEVLAGQSDN